MMTIRPATTDDFKALYGEPPARTVYAEVVEFDGEPVAIGGIAYGGERLLLFSRMSEAFAPHKRLIMQCARLLAAKAKKVGAVAVADSKRPLSAKLLKKLGFQKVAECSEGEVYG